VAKKRKTAGKSGSAKKASGVKKATGAKKKALKARRSGAAKSSSPKELDLRPFKKQLRAHVETLSASKSTDQRVQNAIASLLRLQDELNEECIPTMTIPLE
jgi:hypothetical protein